MDVNIFVGDEVSVYTPFGSESGTVIKLFNNKKSAVVELDNGDEISVGIGDIQKQ